MAVSGKGRYPFQSVWLSQTRTCTCLLTRQVQAGHAGTESSQAWSDWLFTPVAVTAGRPQGFRVYQREDILKYET